MSNKHPSPLISFGKTVTSPVDKNSWEQLLSLSLSSACFVYHLLAFSQPRKPPLPWNKSTQNKTVRKSVKITSTEDPPGLEIQSMNILQTKKLKRKEKLLFTLDPCSASVRLRRNSSTRRQSSMKRKTKTVRLYSDIRSVSSTLSIRETPNFLVFPLLSSLSSSTLFLKS